MIQERAKEFLKKHGMRVQDIDREKLLEAFQKEMAAGLRGEPSSLMMIPSFISIDQPVKTDTPIVVLDAGGTNLRTAVVKFDQKGNADIGSFYKRAMPGTQGELSADEFYDAFAEFLMPVIDASETIGFCFSYSAEVTPDCDARLLYWSKQIEVPSVVGTMIGSGLCKKLEERGYHRKAIIVNDTVATLLAGRSMGITKDYSAYVGFILGTGTNTAYVEKNSRITKRKDLDPKGCMAVNVESGSFKGMPQCDFDKILDESTNDCGTYTFEKMISGGYLGRLGLVVLTQAAKEGLFSDSAKALIESWTDLQNKDLDDFCGGAPAEDNPFLASAFSAEDREMVIALGTPLYERSAVLTAVNIASAVIQTGEGKDPARPVCVNVDGSTFHKTRTGQFQKRVRKELETLLVERRNLHYELVRVDESPVIGAAIAGLK